MAEFHAYWYLTAPETLPPIDTRLLVVGARTSSPRGRLMGAIIRQTSQEQASTQETSIHQDPSEFEVILLEGLGRSRGRGRGRDKSASQPISQPGIQRGRGRDDTGSGIGRIPEATLYHFQV